MLQRGLSVDISGVSSSVVQSLVGDNVAASDAVTVKVLDKALDMQAQTALQLLEALPDSTSSLGQSIDDFA